MNIQIHISEGLYLVKIKKIEFSTATLLRPSYKIIYSCSLGSTDFLLVDVIDLSPILYTLTVAL